MRENAIPRRRSAAQYLLLGTLALLTASPTLLCADMIWKKNGSKLVGKILAQEPQRVQIRMKQGKLEANVWIERSEILRIEMGQTPDEELEQRVSQLKPDDLAGYKELIDWANKNGLKARAVELEAKLPAVERLGFKKDHALNWCRQCDATGKVPCAKCDGKGQLLEPCERCEGKGVVPCGACAARDSTLFRCRRCAGTGEYERFDPARGIKVRTKCDDCAGTGSLPCPTCQGKRQQKCTECDGKKGKPHPCDACSGSPQLVCDRCKGTRIQPKSLTKEEYDVEQRELAAREAKEKAEREAAEKAAREAKEKLERDAKEKRGGEAKGGGA